MLSKKMKFKKTFKNKRNENNTTMNDVSERDKKDWFAEQYEKNIGKPLPRKKLTTDEVLQRLRESSKYRHISEAKAYKKPAPESGTVYYLKWGDPRIKKCMCPDQDCICRGNVMFPRKKIPRGDIHCTSSWMRKLMHKFQKPVNHPSTKNFMMRLADAAGVEASVYKDLEKNGVLSIRGAEFCTARCIRYYGPGQFPNSKFLLDKEKMWSEELKKQLPDNVKDEEKISDGDDFGCTVSTQATVGSDGNLIVGNYSHVLFGTLDGIIIKDIDGTELQISSYNCNNDSSHSTFHNLCNLDKLLSLRDHINLQGLKKHLSVLRRNIYSSIFEMKESSASEKTIATQCEEEDEYKKSSVKISIPTPYNKVVIKALKEEQECPTCSQNKESKEEENLEDCIPKTSTTNIQSPSKLLNEKLSDQTKPRQETFSSKEITQRVSHNMAAKSKTICGSFSNLQQQDMPSRQNHRESNTLIKNVSIDEIKSLYKQHGMQNYSQTFSIDYKLDTINEIKEGLNSQEYLKETIFTDPENIWSNENVCNQISLGRFLPPNSLKIGDLMDNIEESKEPLEVIQQKLSENMFKKEQKLGITSEEIRHIYKEIEMTTPDNTECDKHSFKDFFKRKISTENPNLQNITIKKYSKILSLNLNNDKHATRKILKSKALNSKNEEKLLCTNVVKHNDSIHIEPVINVALSNLKTGTKDSKSRHSFLNRSNRRSHQDSILLTDCINKGNSKAGLMQIWRQNKQFESQDVEITEKKVNCLSGIGDTIYITNKETSKLEENSAVRILFSVENNNSKEELNKGPSLTKKISNVSLQLKKLLWKQTYKCFKSLPVYTNFRKSKYNTQRNISDVSHKMFIKGKDIIEEPKFSEKEVYTIQYSEPSAMKAVYKDNILTA